MKKRLLSLMLVFFCAFQLLAAPAYALTDGEEATVIAVEPMQEPAEEPAEEAAGLPKGKEAFSVEIGEAVSAETKNTAAADDTVFATGACGRNGEANLTYTIYADGRLIISGSGGMQYYDTWSSPPPWQRYQSRITSVVVEEGVTSVASSAFSEMSNLVSAKLPSTLDTILSSTFSYCRSLTSVQIAEGTWNIASGAFQGCSALQRIDLPDSVTTIQEYVFEDCTSLSAIGWSSNLRTIGSSAFRNCDALTSIVFPGSLEEIGSGAFWECDNLTAVSFANASVCVGSGAFQACTALSSVLFSKNTQLDGNPFGNCKKLNTIQVPEGSTYLYAENNVLFSADKKTLLCYPNGLGGAYTVPSCVTAVAAGAFDGCDKLTSVTMGDQVDFIGASVFRDCTALASVRLPAAVDPTEDLRTNYWFENCASLVSVKLPTGIKYIDSRCFSNCKSLVSVELPAGVQYLNSSCFENCTALANVNLPEGLKYINDYSFENCTALTELDMPDTVLSIGMSAFSGCTALTRIGMSDNLTSIAMNAFRNCTALTEIELPDTITYIGQQCFENTLSLKEVRLPAGLTYVSHSMFRDSGVRKVTVPASVTEIDSMFVGSSYGYGENREVVIVFEGAPPVISSAAFQGATVRAYYPAGKGWSDEQINQNYGFASNVTWICGDGFGDDGFAGCGENASWAVANGVLNITGSGPMFDFEANNMPWYSQNSVITSVVIGEGITSIGANAFCNMGNITSVTVPSTVSRVGERAFYYCGKLESISLPDSVSEIGKEAFYSCDRLTAPLFPAGMKTLAEGVYGGCAGFTAVAIPAHITDIGESAFASCSNLETVSIPASVTAIGQMAFNACAKLTAITVEEGNVFYSAADGILYNKEKTALLQYPCGKAEECIVPEGVKTVASYAFRDARVTSIRFTGAAPVIEEYAFYGLRIKVRYPFGTAGWEGAAQGSYGGTIEWIAYDPITGKDLAGTRLADLTQLDYIVLSQMAYRSFRSKELNRPLAELAKEWNSPVWDGYTYTYTELTENLADWYVADIHTSALDFELVDVDFAGYYAVIFKNAFGEVVIAYRGSIPLQLKLAAQAEKWGDVIGDWIVSDLMTEILDVFSPQFHMALETYERVLLTEEPAAVATTGHSLGGALANVVSAYSGCKCESVNAISAMDTAYGSQPDLMGKNFDGVDRWNILDHANECDYIAGVFEWFFTTCIKPYAMHESALEDGNTGFKLANHSVSSIMQRDTEGEPQLSRILGYRIPNEMIKSSMLTSAAMLWLGTSAQDSMKAPAVSLRQVMYGGMGADTLIGGRFGDTIVGGKGDDTLDGGYGNDTYYYFAGDGMDTIRDIGGRDELALYGMEWNDVSVEVDADYVYVLYAGETVARISRSVRSAKNASFAVVIHRGTGSSASSETIELDDYFTGSYSSRVEVACPVRILVVSEAKEEVVYIVPDGAEMVDYTEYGNFYVYEESEGDYGKILDLADGYYICIMGTGEGEMTVQHWDTGEEGLVSNGKVEAVQVTPKFGAAVVRGKDDTVVLRVGGDELPFVKDPSDEEGGEVPEVPVAGEITRGKWTMTLDGVIYLNYYPTLTGFDADFDFAANGGVVVWTGEEAPTSREQLQVGAENCEVLTGMQQNAAGEWFVRTGEIFAKNLGDRVYIRPFVKTGKDTYIYQNGAPYYSPAHYCYDMLNNPGERVDTRYVCAALLQYGAAAQKYFNYKVKEPVTMIPAQWPNADLSAYDLSYDAAYLDEMKLDAHVRALAGTLTGEKTGISFESATLSLRGAIQMQMKYRLDPGVINWKQVKKAEVLFWTEAAVAAADTMAYDRHTYSYAAALLPEDGAYTALSDYILAKDLGKTLYYSCRIQMADGTVYRTGLGYYSPEACVGDYMKIPDSAEAAVSSAIAVYSEMARIRFIVNAQGVPGTPVIPVVPVIPDVPVITDTPEIPSEKE